MNLPVWRKVSYADYFRTQLAAKCLTLYPTRFFLTLNYKTHIRYQPREQPCEPLKIMHILTNLKPVDAVLSEMNDRKESVRFMKYRQKLFGALVKDRREYMYSDKLLKPAESDLAISSAHECKPEDWMKISQENISSAFDEALQKMWIDKCWWIYSQFKAKKYIIDLPIRRYKRLLFFLLSHFEVEKAELLLADLAPQIESIAIYEETLKIVKCFINCEFDRAKECLKEYEDSFLPFTLKWINRVIKKYGADRKWLREFFKRMDTDYGIKPNSKSSATIISYYLRENQVEPALSLYERMKKLKLMPERISYDHLILLCGRNGRKEEAQRIFKDMLLLNGHPNAFSFAHILQACSNAGDLNACRKYFEEMENYNIEPNAVHYTSLISICGRQDKIDVAGTYFYNMIVNQRAPNLKTYTALMAAWTRNLKYAIMAPRIFDKMKEKGLKPDVVAYTALIHAYTKALRFKEAMTIYQQMLKDNIEPNAYTFTVLIKAFTDSGQNEYAGQIFSKMQEQGIKPTLHTYCTLMSGYCKAGKLENALQVYHDMIKGGIIPDAVCINCLMDACERAGQIDSVFGFYNNMWINKNPAPNHVSVNIVMLTCFKHKRLAEGKKIFYDLVNEGGLHENNLRTYIKMMGREKQVDELIEALMKLTEKKIQLGIREMAFCLCFIEDHGGLETLWEIEKKLRNRGIKFPSRIYRWRHRNSNPHLHYRHILEPPSKI
ncbi:hypothetical protein G9A89_002463 [Geosiphon pyriformis]|nr:hypothetical protein G9A89_002463 [Geosiphon pyriformis]